MAKSTQWIDLDANTLAALGNVSPEKWEGLSVGPKLADGSFVLLAGTDNDFSVSQLVDGVQQYDTYFKPGSSTRILCQMDTAFAATCKTAGSDGALGGEVGAGFDFTGYQLIPAVLHAYKVSGDEMQALGFLRPVPEPGTYAMMLGGLALLLSVARRKSAQRA